jgi:hypothetical protein
MGKKIILKLKSKKPNSKIEQFLKPFYSAIIALLIRDEIC